MFTGIVEERGEVVALVTQTDSAVLRVRGPLVTSDAQPGDSIAVNGCCLTVVAVERDVFTADVMKETLDKTSLGLLEPGSSVNLERSVTPQTRLGGHLVQGHVDAFGQLESRTHSAHWDVVWISLPASLARYVVSKGSIAVDGVSLTVVDVRDGHDPGFSVSLIPTTVELTTLGLKQPGDPVNLEVDVMAKYVERILDRAVAERILDSRIEMEESA
jgi:riboflavin synthase